MIDVQQLSKQFGKHEALKGLSLTVPEGSAFLLVGANGAGKTTLLKILMNLLEPTSGSARILGVDSRQLSPKELESIGYVAENQQLPGRLKVEEYLNYLRPFYSAWDRQLEHETLTRLKLPLETRIKDLSYGMRMKLALLCALAYRPELLIMDEPFGALDPLVRDQVMEGLTLIAGETTILMSSHELTEVESFPTHVAFLDQGHIVFQEPMEELTGRVHEVKVTLDRPASLLQPAPAEWVDVKQSGNVFTFVHTQFAERELDAQVRLRMEGVLRVEAHAMALRPIFTSLMRAAQK